jgi:hypothetical protein
MLVSTLIGAMPQSLFEAFSCNTALHCLTNIRVPVPVGIERIFRDIRHYIIYRCFFYSAQILHVTVSKEAEVHTHFDAGQKKFAR